MAYFSLRLRHPFDLPDDLEPEQVPLQLVLPARPPPAVVVVVVVVLPTGWESGRWESVV